MSNLTMEKLVAYCKQYGFIFQGSEIYGGLANTWDYGPLGSRLKNNIKDAWRKRFIQERPNAYEVDSAILMHPRVWEASGHVESFSDPLIDCKQCHSRYRADKLIEDATNGEQTGDGWSNEQLFDFLKEHNCDVTITQGYGMTEVAGPTCFGSLGSDKLGSIGIPLPDMDYKIVKIGTFDKAKVMEDGEICISGPTVMKGYFNDKKETDKEKIKRLEKEK